MLEDGRAIFEQIAQMIEDQIIDGTLPAGARAPSTNELAAFYRINPGTAAKGVGLLVEAGLLVKRRGLGMFVADGAADTLRAARRQEFRAKFLTPMLTEAHRLGLTTAQVRAMVAEAADGATPTLPADGEPPNLPASGATSDTAPSPAAPQQATTERTAP